MAGGGATGHWRRVLRYGFAGALCLLAGLNVAFGTAWYLCLGIAVTGGIIMVGQRRIWRPGVSQSGGEIICRYIPWYEGNAYATIVLIPLLGVASLGAGFAPTNPAWLRLVGVILLGAGPLAVYGVVRMWRRCFLCVSSSALTARLAKGETTEIRRARVKSITPKMVPNGVSGASPQVEITYHATDSNRGAAKTMLLGTQLTVQPINLLNALIAWRDDTQDDPHEFLDRVERILRGCSMAGG
jgi:hypothetical protein